MKRLLARWRNRHRCLFEPQLDRYGLPDWWGLCSCGRTVEYEKPWESF